MATLDDLKAADVAEDAKIDALIQAHKDLKTMVADLTAQVAANAQDPAKIQELVDAANAKAAAIDAELAKLSQIMKTDVPAFNQLVRDQNIPAVVVK